jgi:hypothetical protein
MPARFWDKVDRRGPDECWPWTAGCTGDGYGSFRPGGRGVPCVGAHIVAYELLIGPVPDGMTLDHVVCHRRDCVNPAHTEPVTAGENTRRGNLGWPPLRGAGGRFTGRAPQPIGGGSNL